MAGNLTYQQAGVDTRKAAALVGDIGTHVRRTQQTRKLWGAFGLFAACYDLSSYKEPVMMTGCDGVGTKLELLLEHDLLETAGKDLVAMSVNDILTTGGDPLTYFAQDGWREARSVASGRTHVRKGPTLKSAIVTTLYAGSVVMVQRTETEWWRARGKGFEGYIRQDRLAFE